MRVFILVFVFVSAVLCLQGKRESASGLDPEVVHRRLLWLLFVSCFIPSTEGIINNPPIQQSIVDRYTHSDVRYSLNVMSDVFT